MNYRHGDMALISAGKLPSGVKASQSKVLMVGSGGKDHSFEGGVFYPKTENLTVGFLQAKNTILFHEEHGNKIEGKKLRETKVEDDIYEVRKQQEDTHEGMKPLQD